MAPFYPTPTGELPGSKVTPIYPTLDGKPLKTSIIEKLSSSIKFFDVNSVINKLSTAVNINNSISPANIVEKVATKYFGNPTGNETEDKGIFNLSDPRYENIKTLAQIPSSLLGTFYINPVWDFLSTGAELITGKPLPKLKISALTKDMGNFIDASSAGQYYQDQIDNGLPEKDAYKNTLWRGINDALLLAGPIKSGLKTSIKTFRPESFIKSEITSIPKETLFDYLSGKKTAYELGLNSETQRLITDKMKVMTTQEKAKFLQGFDLLQAKPSFIGKLFGVSQEEANKILTDVFNGPIREASAGALPGYKMNYQAGGANIKGEPVGFGDNALIQEAKKYKSAEDFVKAQGTPVYHGTSIENANKINTEGFKVGAGKGISGQTSGDFIYATGNKSGANRYVSDRIGIKNPTVVEGGFNGKVLEIQGKMADFEAFGEASKKLGIPLEIGSQGKPTMLNMPAIKKAMQEQGYGAISFLDKYANGTKAYAILPDQLKTKSQLTDIWNKAQENKTPTKIDRIESANKIISNLENKFPSASPIDPEGKNLKDFKQSSIILENMREAILNNPIATLEKYEAKSGIFKGELPEVLGTTPKGTLIKTRNKDVLDFIKSGDKYIQEAGYNDAEEARAAYQEWKQMKEYYKDLLNQFTKDVRNYESFSNQDIKYLSKLAREEKLIPSDVEPPTGRGNLKIPEMDFYKWKDKTALTLNRETMERNIESVAGEDKKAIKEFLLDPVRENETNRIIFNNKLRREVKNKIVDGYKIKSKSIQSKFVQRYGEKQLGETEKDNLDKLKMERPNDWLEIKKASEYFREIYDNLLDKVNKERQKFGYKPIPKHEDYFRHFKQISDTIAQFGVILNENDLPTEISGMTDIFNPGKPFSTAELKRRGELGSTEDAVLGIDNYIDSISKQIFHIDSIQRARLLEKYIRNFSRIASQVPGGDPIQLQNFVANLHDYANLLAGKKSSIDRSFEGLLGRKVYGLMNALRSRSGANMVGANLSAAITNYIPFTQSLATTKKIYAIQGIADALIIPIKKNSDYFIIDGIRSKFLTRRFPIEDIDPRGLKKTIEYANWIFKKVDQFTARSVVFGKYQEYLNKGYSKEVSINLADSYAGKVLADRSFGQLPNLFNTKSLGFFTQFQTEINNMYSFIKKDIPNINDGNIRKIISSIIQFFIYSFLFNAGYKKITGRRPTIDPIYAGLTLLGMTDESSGQSFLERTKNAALNILENLPFSGILLGGGRIPFSSAIPNPYSLLKGTSSLEDELLKPVTYLLPPLGGGQIKKSIKGFQSSKLENNWVNRVKATIFGPLRNSDSDKITSSISKSSATAKTKLGQLDDSITEVAKQTWEKVKILGVGTPEADQLVNEISEEEYTAYKLVRTSDNDYWLKIAEKVVPIVRQANSLGFGSPEADSLVQDISKDEYKLYKSIKDSLYGKEDSGTRKWDEQSFVEHVTNMSKAWMTDPKTAFENLIQGDWKIIGLINKQIIVERMPVNASEAIKKEAAKNNSKYKLDHIIPLEIGGNNSSENLQIIDTSSWASNTNTENLLGKALKSGKITGEQAREYIIRYKAGKNQILSSELKKEFEEKYNSQILTSTQIKSLIETKR